MSYRNDLDAAHRRIASLEAERSAKDDEIAALQRVIDRQEQDHSAAAEALQKLSPAELAQFCAHARSLDVWARMGVLAPAFSLLLILAGVIRGSSAPLILGAIINGIILLYALAIDPAWKAERNNPPTKTSL